MADKFDVLWEIEAALTSATLRRKFKYLWHVWNTDDERTFEEFEAGVAPHDAEGNPYE